MLSDLLDKQCRGPLVMYTADGCLCTRHVSLEFMLMLWVTCLQPQFDDSVWLLTDATLSCTVQMHALLPGRIVSSSEFRRV